MTLEATNKRTFVVGDIHGCYDELVDLLDRIGFSANDLVVAVGDLTVKGPKSREVLDLVISDSRFSSVMGNQDLAVLKRLQNQDGDYTKAQKATAKELEDDRDKYLNLLSSFPLTIDLGSHLVVHAGLRPGIPIEKQDPDDLLELRTLGEEKSKRRGTAWYKVYRGDKFVLFGHWPRRAIHRGPKAIGLDTGCVYGNRLTAYLVETGEFFSVPALRPYSRPSKWFYQAPLTGQLPSIQTLMGFPSTESIHL